LLEPLLVQLRAQLELLVVAKEFVPSARPEPQDAQDDEEPPGSYSAFMNHPLRAIGG
jgi:hypothetical protein